MQKVQCYCFFFFFVRTFATTLPSGSVTVISKKHTLRPFLRHFASQYKRGPFVLFTYSIVEETETVHWPSGFEASANVKSASVNMAPPITNPAAFRWRSSILSRHFA